MNSMFQKLKDYLDTEEGKESLKRFFENIRIEEERLNSQLERFHLKFGDKSKFFDVVQKIIEKYNSEKYRNREYYKVCCQPRESLYFFLYEYAKKYGREVTDDEYGKYGNIFTAGLYYVNGFFFNLMQGQGSVVKVMIDENEIIRVCETCGGDFSLGFCPDCDTQANSY